MAKKQISTTVDEAVFAVLDDHKWDVRLTMNQLVGKAVEDYMTANNLKVEAPAEPVKEDKVKADKA